MKKTLSVMFGLLALHLCAGEKVELGFSVKDITPDFSQSKNPKGIQTAGYGNRWAKTIRDRLYVRTAAIRDSKGRLLVILTSDNQKFHPVDAMIIQDWFAKKFKVSRWDLIINGSHTHSSPRWYFLDRNKFSAIYREQLLKAVRESICQAVSNMHPGLIRFALLKTCKMSINRRLPNSKGAITFRPYLKGPVDNDLPVFAFYGAGGKKLKALLWSFACHPTSLTGRRISADYPGAVAAAIKKQFGSSVIPMFAQGAGGDIKPPFYKYYTRKGRKYLTWHQPSDKELDAFGEKFAAIIKKGFADKKFKTVDVALKIAGKRIAVPMIYKDKHSQKYWKEKLKTAKTPKEKYLAKSELTRYDEKGRYSYAFYATRVVFNPKLQIIATSNEVCHQHGLNVKNLYKPATTVYFGYCQYGSPYMPTNKMQKMGKAAGYEVRVGMKTPKNVNIDKVVLDGISSLNPK